MKPQKPVKQLPAIEVSLFCSQAAMILRSGILLYDGMDVLRQSYADTPYSGVMESVCQAVREGSELHGALAAAGAFPQYMVQMVRAGEMTGHLDEVLARLSVYYESEDRLRSEVRSAVTYPLVLVGMLAVVIGILVVRVLPIFDLIAKEGNIPQRDMFNTFNMGVGMVLVVPAAQADKAVELLGSQGQEAYPMGEIVAGEKGVELC